MLILMYSITDLYRGIGVTNSHVKETLRVVDLRRKKL